MSRRDWWIRNNAPTWYVAAVGLAVVAQLLRFAVFTNPTQLRFITYAPFAVAAALIGGFGPGLVGTALCCLEAIYFSTDPILSFRVKDPSNWHGVLALLITGSVASLLAERLRRSNLRVTEAHRRTAAILASIADGFIAVDPDWNVLYANSAAIRILRMAPAALRGQRFWDALPHAGDLPLGATIRESMASQTRLQAESYYPEPVNLWLEARCYPTEEGLSIFIADISQRMQSEEQLRLLESAAMQTSDGILIVKNASEVSARALMFANPAFQKITGFDSNDLQQGALERFVGTEDSSGPERLSERLIRRKNGFEFWVEQSIHPLQDERGHVSHSVLTFRDITSRKEAEETSRLLSAIVEDSDDAIIAMTLDGTVLTWNRGAAQIYGYAGPEMTGQSISRLVPSDRANEMHEIMDNLRRGARTVHHETDRVCKDGRRISVSLTISPILDAEAYVVGASVVARDITERKSSQRALALSEERYRSLVVVSSQVVWTTDAHGEVVDSNRMWREFTGQTPEQIAGHGWIHGVHPDDRERALDVWSRAVQNRSFYDTEYRLRRRDGEYRWMAVHGVPVLEEDGSIREWVGTCADIHDRKVAEEQIRALNDELEQRVRQRTAELESANREL